MRVLLTGAAGFIGTRIGAQLSAAGHEVVGVDVAGERFTVEDFGLLDGRQFADSFTRDQPHYYQ